uniref:HTH cro/C1-type domain-containing protein n=1 Tax=mine drainage metagenome TaxID=410659 RepID=E6QL57_9ZZZZ
MKTLYELGEAVAAARKERKLRQKDVAAQAGISTESLLRFERGQATEFGSRKLLAVLAVLDLEISFTPTGRSDWLRSGSLRSGSLDELRRERQGQ